MQPWVFNFLFVRFGDVLEVGGGCKNEQVSALKCQEGGDKNIPFRKSSQIHEAFRPCEEGVQRQRG